MYKNNIKYYLLTIIVCISFMGYKVDMKFYAMFSIYIVNKPIARSTSKSQ